MGEFRKRGLIKKWRMNLYCVFIMVGTILCTLNVSSKWILIALWWSCRHYPDSSSVFQFSTPLMWIPATPPSLYTPFLILTLTWWLHWENGSNQNSTCTAACPTTWGVCVDVILSALPCVTMDEGPPLYLCTRPCLPLPPQGHSFLLRHQIIVVCHLTPNCLPTHFHFSHP